MTNLDIHKHATESRIPNDAKLTACTEETSNTRISHQDEAVFPKKSIPSSVYHLNGDENSSKGGMLVTGMTAKYFCLHNSAINNTIYITSIESLIFVI